ncbi:PD-(D/E)XK nuclease family protein [Thermoplasmatales archaeon AK]|nr:PD-(D/E)XK nuclease family protein [Thermoplasmatales archaeon AK]
MQGREESYGSLEEFIKSQMGGGYFGCVTLAKEVLQRTGHIPTVTNIARGAGYCTYYARLSESIGIRRFFDYSVDHYSGKGKAIHKILAYSALKLFPGAPNDNEIKDAIEKAASENREILSRDRIFKTDRENILDSAYLLLKSLVSNLDRICELLGINKLELSPIVEQQFLDYDLHMRGIPDLILESMTKKKAIVVEWKTYGSSEMRYEEAQAVAYSLLEASRLGYSDPRTAVLGTLSPDSHSVDVIPVVIKASIKSQLGPHPFLGGDFSKESHMEFSYLLDDVALEAEHLTSLLANTSYFDINKKGGDKEYRVNLLRLTPNQLWKGKPSKQEKWPCRSRDGKPFCNLMEPCKFYFGGSQYEHDSIDSDMWLLRFKVFENKENSLLIYRALHDIFKIYKGNPLEKDAFTHLSQGGGFIYSPGDFPIKKNGIPQIIIPEKNRFRVETLDELETVDVPYSLQLRGSRKLRDFEKDEKISFVVPDGKTVLLTMMDSWNPLLSISVFAKISEVKSVGEQIEYVIEVPSTVLDFQMSIFMKYLNMHIKTSKFLMFEVNADLTQMELNSIHALQYALKESLGKESKPSPDVNMTENERKIEEELLNAQEEQIREEEIEDTESYGLVDTLAQLVKRSSEKS